MIERIFQLLAFMTSYRELNNSAIRVDHRIKTLALLMTWVFLLLENVPLKMIILSIPAILLLFMSGKKLIKYTTILALIPSTILAIIVLVVNQYGPLHPKTLTQAFAVGYRVFIISAISLTYMTTTNPVEIAGSMTRFPRVHDFTIILARLVPLTISEVGDIIGVQRTLRRPIHKVLFPLLLTVFSRGDDLADSLYMRGYGISKKRTRIRKAKGLTKESICILSTLIATLIVYLLM